MKNKYMLIGGFLLVLGVIGGIVITTVDDKSKVSITAPGQEHISEETLAQDQHTDHEDDIHDQDDEHDENEILAKDEHDDHEGEKPGEESDHVEMTVAQQKEIGLVLSTTRSGDIEHSVSLVGEVRLHDDRMAHLVPQVEGIVHSVAVSLGEVVREGQVLAIIESTELAELKADYLEKVHNLELSRRTFERKQYLKQENIASEADWLEAQSAFQISETLFYSAKRRLVTLGMSEQVIDDLAAARNETFGHYPLKSPIAGTIIAKHITRGEKIGAEEVFTVADLSVVWVDLQIPAKDLGQVKKGIPVEITSTEGDVAQGKLMLVGPVVDKESRTALGRVVLPNPDGLWKPGIFVKGQIQGETSSSAVMVSSEAIQNIDELNIVFVPQGDGFEPVTVTLGKSSNGVTEILSGLKAGDQYVAKGAFDLKAIKVTSGAGGHAGHGH